MRKIRVLALCPDPTDGCSFYRGMGPLLALERNNEQIEIIMGGPSVSDYSWPAVKRADVLFMQRPAHPNHVTISETAKRFGVPIWSDFDDDLTCIPADNPAADAYMQPDCQMAIRRCAELSSVITVTTHALKERLGKWCGDVRIIPNAFDDYELKREEPPKDRNKVIMWRGSPAHAADVAACADGVVEFANAHPEWSMYFMGWNPWPITQRLENPKQAAVFRFRDIKTYMGLLANISAPIHIVPLVDNEFNRAKSNIAWIEASAAGSAVLASPLPEWDLPGVTSANPVNFGEALHSMAVDNLVARASESWSHIKDNLMLSLVNGARLRTVIELSEKR